MGEPFDLDNLQQSGRELFRFSVDELRLLRIALRIPDVMTTTSRINEGGDEALCMLLRRFSYPCRLCDLKALFGRHKSVICEIILDLVHFFNEQWEELLFWPEQ
eukprot:TRINITY_DN5996_c0_g4_i1.p2 TRINITY_DN5996_c0_g4~~TRINITY_DN5996_c0_g4_i1.p2  ORF type:complete len:104 (-),score=8.04 TRINITY_DN5996_c0_g4_i1:629-940(-)